MIDTSNKRIAHLLRRAGFGASEDQLKYYAAKGLGATIDELVNYGKVSNPVDSEPAKATGDELRPQDVRSWWVKRMLYTTRPLEEKMTLYWHNHFATAASKVRNADYLLQQNKFLRANALGNFRTILKGISRDPAMVIWLDNYRNRKGSPNENYARELMELFSLGIGNYTEQDIKESARAFTGWFARPKGEGFRFVKAAHDYGSKEFMGRKGRFDGDDIIDIILDQQAAPKFLAKKLVTFFITDTPGDQLVAPFAQLLKENNYEIRPVVDRILRSEAFYATDHRLAKVKSPAEYVIGSLRMIAGGLSEEQIPNITRILSSAMRQMGQDLLNPPNVKGWDGGLSWITTSAMVARANLAASLLGDQNTGRTRGGNRISIVDSDRLLAGLDSTKPEVLLDRFTTAFGCMELNPGTKQKLIQYLLDVGVSEDSSRVCLQMLMASPEYQLS